MALVVEPVGINIQQKLRDICYLADDTGKVVYGPEHKPVTDYPSAWAAAYDEYALKGVVNSATIPTSTPAIIEQYFIDQKNGVYRGSSGHATISAFAHMFADYWETVYTGDSFVSSEPLHGGDEILRIYNDAQSFYQAFYDAIMNSITTQRQTTPWLMFLTNIEKVVLGIRWHVIESKMVDGVLTEVDNIETIT